MQQSSKIRSVLIFLFFIFLYGSVIVNLYFLQIRQSSFFSTLANRQYHIELTSHPARGEIFDRYGRPVAVNKESLSAFILPKQIQDKAGLSNFLQQHFPQALERLESYHDKHFMYVSRRFPLDICERAQCDQIIDLKFMKEPSRFYPNEAMGQIVGITNIDNQGLFGIEQIYDTVLAGKPSQVVLEKDARSNHFYFQQALQKGGTPGKPVRLTIDSDLQYLAQAAVAEATERLQAELGMALVMDPKNGEILALVSAPDFDPNNISADLDFANTKPTPITDAYEFGSIMKVFVALGALAEGVVQPDEIIDCENRAETQIDGMRFTTTKFSVGGEMPFSEVVSRSNNIGMVKVAKRLGEKLYDHYKRCGFGAKTGVNFLGEQAGFISHPSKWSKRSIISLAFGYEISATLLQFARAFSLIANGGYLVTPTLILDEPRPEPQKKYESDVIEIVQDILRETVQNGTGVRAKIHGYDVMGKTGTANLAMDGSYSQDNLIFTFAGIVQKGSYQRVIVTCIKDAQSSKKLYGANTAAPLFEKIAEQMLVHDRVV